MTTFGRTEPSQDAFEALASQIWRRAADRLPPDARWLAAVSPLAVRVPDSRLLWHPGLRTRRGSALGRALFAEVVGAKVRGLAKIVLGRLVFESRSVGPRGEGLLVVPSALGMVSQDGGFSTPYIELSPEREALVFGPPGACGPDATPIALGRGTALGLSVRLAWAGLRAAVAARGVPGDRYLLALEWLVWALSLRWAYDLCLARAVETRLSAGEVTALASVHEMNSIGRTLWIVAGQHHARRAALQHAEVTPGKRWYFALPEEREAGVEVPDVLVVYDRQLADRLAPWFPDTRFELGCSARYASWRGVRPGARATDPCVLFVGALASFDNDIVLGAIKRIAESPTRAHVAVRLHPAAEIPRTRRHELDQLATSGLVETSSGLTLSEDLARASVVVGMSTTVLEEALLLGRPVVQLLHPDFLEYIDLRGVTGAVRVPHDELTVAQLDQAMASPVDASPIAQRLGLENPVVDHAVLLDVAHAIRLLGPLS